MRSSRTAQASVFARTARAHAASGKLWKSCVGCHCRCAAAFGMHRESQFIRTMATRHSIEASDREGRMRNLETGKRASEASERSECGHLASQPVCRSVPQRGAGRARRARHRTNQDRVLGNSLRTPQASDGRSGAARPRCFEGQACSDSVWAASRRGQSL